jgi:hypothetical protein
MTDITLSQNVVQCPNVLVQNLAEEAVLLNLDSEAYFGLNEMGTRMFTVLQEQNSIAEAHQQLLAEYDIDPESLKTDLLKLIEQLVEQGLVTVS